MPGCTIPPPAMPGISLRCPSARIRSEYDWYPRVGVGGGGGVYTGGVKVGVTGATGATGAGVSGGIKGGFGEPDIAIPPPSPPRLISASRAKIWSAVIRSPPPNSPWPLPRIRGFSAFKPIASRPPPIGARDPGGIPPAVAAVSAAIISGVIAAGGAGVETGAVGTAVGVGATGVGAGTAAGVGAAGVGVGAGAAAGVGRISGRVAGIEAGTAVGRISGRVVGVGIGVGAGITSGAGVYIESIVGTGDTGGAIEAGADSKEEGLVIGTSAVAPKGAVGAVSIASGAGI
jgi:hypothetical protein